MALLMYSFITKSEELFLYTDKFGSRALFYTETSSEVIGSGRVRPVCHALGSRLGLNSFCEVSEYIYFGCFIQNGKTLFNDIFVLPSAAEFVFKKRLAIRQYWLPKVDYQMPTFVIGNEFERFYQDFKDVWLSVFERCGSLIGESESALIQLSAGFDSRTILSELSQKSHCKLTSFNISTTPSFEADTSALVAETRNIDHQSLVMSEESFLENYEIDVGVLYSDAMVHGCLPSRVHYTERWLQGASSFSVDSVGIHSWDLTPFR